LVERPSVVTAFTLRCSPFYVCRTFIPVYYGYVCLVVAWWRRRCACVIICTLSVSQTSPGLTFATTLVLQVWLFHPYRLFCCLVITGFCSLLPRVFPCAVRAKRSYRLVGYGACHILRVRLSDAVLRAHRTRVCYWLLLRFIRTRPVCVYAFCGLVCAFCADGFFAFAVPVPFVPHATFTSTVYTRCAALFAVCRVLTIEPGRLLPSLAVAVCTGFFRLVL